MGRRAGVVPRYNTGTGASGQRRLPVTRTVQACGDERLSAFQGKWSEIQVGGHLCDVYEPPNPSPQQFAAIYLHGVHLQRLAGNADFSRQFDRHGLRVIAPHAARSWWADRICSDFDRRLTAERHVMENIVPFVRRFWRAETPRVGLLGTSMGGQGALRMAFKYPSIFPVVAALAPAIDYHTRLRDSEPDEQILEMYGDEETARQDTATLHVHPLNWPRNIFFACDPTDSRWLESSERLQSKLVSLGIPHEVDLETSGGGHGFEYYNRMAEKTVEFLAARLERERLRVA